MWAEFYRVQTKALLQVVKRNEEQFPDNFTFRLTEQEFVNLRYQIGTSSSWGAVEPREIRLGARF